MNGKMSYKKTDDLDDNSGSFKRRTLLKSISAGSVGLAAMSSVSSAHSNDRGISAEESRRMKLATEAYSTDSALRQAVDTHASRVRTQLAAEGRTFPTNLGKLDEIRAFPDVHDGIPTAHIVAEHTIESGLIQLHILPQAEEAFAIEKADSQRLLYEGSDSGPEPMDFCQTDTYCDGCCTCKVPTSECDPNCDYSYYTEEECCQKSDGSVECTVVDRYCDSSCPGCCG